MNYEQFHKDFIFICWFWLPAALIILKDLVQLFLFIWHSILKARIVRKKKELELKYGVYFSFSYIRDAIKEKRLKRKDYLDLDDDEKAYNKLFSKTFHIVERVYEKISSVCFVEFGWYALYCLFAWIIAVIMVCFFFFGLRDDFNAQKRFYANGQYTRVLQFEKFEQMPSWKIDPKSCIEEARRINNIYFDKNGNINKSKVRYIIPDENGNYPILDSAGKSTGKYLSPINMKRMYAAFLNTCENKIEIFD
jgi:hypothetical protein